MAEYICELPVEGMASFVSGSTTIPVHEPIIRCSDCEFFDTRKCKSQWPFRLDGFCAWGRRAE